MTADREAAIREALIRAALARTMIPDYEAMAALDSLLAELAAAREREERRVRARETRRT